ncbi:MAG: type 4b pilus protein PilO2 [Achromobacter sp.]
MNAHVSPAHPVPPVPARYAHVSMGGDAVWVFGLHWIPLIGGHADAQARARARRAQATHYVWGGERGIVAGYGQLPALRGQPWCAAALAFARSYPEGIAAALVPLPDGRLWLIAAQDGTVIARTDTLFEHAAHAQAALDALMHALPGCRTIDVADPDAFLHMLGRTPAPQWVLRAVQPAWLRTARRLKGGWALAAAAVAIGMVWRVMQPSHHAETPSPNALSDVQRALLWRTAVRQQWGAMQVHLPDELRRVMGSLERLPIDLDGWGLRQATCRAGGARWQCEAQFLRDGASATNATFNARVPAGWRVRFDLLQGAALTWTVPSDETQLNAVMAWRHGDEGESAERRVDVQFASHMQRIGAAFTQVSLSARQAVPLIPPVDAAGLPVARAAGIPELWQRALRFEGPLRSFALLAHPPATIAWHEITVGIDTPPDVSIKLSPLTARLTGLVYDHL